MSQIVALTHVTGTVGLTALAWTVQIVVYPAFALVPRIAWKTYHAAHSRRIAVVLAPLWILQVASLPVLVLTAGGPPTWLLVADAALVAIPIALTAPAARLHGRLDPTTCPADLHRLLRVNLARALVWTAGSASALAIATFP